MERVYFYYLDCMLERLYGACTEEEKEKAIVEAKKDGYLVDEENNSIISTRKSIDGIEGYTESEYIDSNIDSYMGYQLKTLYDSKNSHSRFNVTSRMIFELLSDDEEEGNYLIENDIEEVLTGKINYDEYLARLCKNVAICQFELILDDMKDKFEMFTKSDDNSMIDTD